MYNLQPPYRFSMHKIHEQRKWIADKEAAGNEILDQNDGSSAQMDSSLKMAELTDVYKRQVIQLRTSITINTV